MRGLSSPLFVVSFSCSLPPPPASKRRCHDYSLDECKGDDPRQHSTDSLPSLQEIYVDCRAMAFQQSLKAGRAFLYSSTCVCRGTERAKLPWPRGGSSMMPATFPS
jgi:hypothetical protein